MLVHITLEFTPDEAAAQANWIVQELTRAGVRKIDTRFLSRYALIEGDADESAFDSIRALGFVVAVEADGPVGLL